MTHLDNDTQKGSSLEKLINRLPKESQAIVRRAFADPEDLEANRLMKELKGEPGVVAELNTQFKAAQNESVSDISSPLNIARNNMLNPYSFVRSIGRKIDKD